MDRNDAPAETLVPYVSSHASLMRLPVSSLCNCDSYFNYKLRHYFKQNKVSAVIISPQELEQNPFLDICNLFEFVSFYDLVSPDTFLILSSFCLQLTCSCGSPVVTAWNANID